MRGSAERALAWLLKNQRPDGSWAAAEAQYDVGVTALALRAFVLAGRTPQDAAVRAGLGFLIAAQDCEGCIGLRQSDRYLLNHILATLALCEAYGATGLLRLRGPAKRAVDFVLDAQNPGSGWRYFHQAGENDTHVTGWAVQALKSAASSGLRINPIVSTEGARAWFEKMWYRPAPDRWVAAYQHVEAGCPVIPLDEFDRHPSMTAMALLSVPREDRHSAGAVRTVSEDPPRWGKTSTDYFYWHLGSRVLRGPWCARAVEILEKHQQADGSWEPVDRWSVAGGTVYATAINALTLMTERVYSATTN